MTRWFCFDVGEVLVDETRVWTAWADILGISAFTLMAVLGAAIERGEDHEAAFPRLGLSNWRAREPEVEDAFGGIRAEDIFPDALPALAALRAAGYRLAVIGNQPERRHAELAALGFEPDVMAMSDALGVHKPSPAFFEAVLELLGADAADVAYVGDRIDNDVTPATAAGMRAVWLRRGPWGRLHEDRRRAASLIVDSLDELVSRSDEVWERRPDVSVT